MARATKLPPGRRQYLDLKRQHPDALLLFRMGDFYETFDEDARIMARVLDITLTQRDVGGGVKAPLAGIPHHALDSYLGRLIKAGLKIAVCEQTSDPAAAPGIVDRAVVRIVTPGTVLEPGLLDEGRNNYLAAAVAHDSTAGLAYVDVTTSEFVAGELPVESLSAELHRLSPAELLADEGVEAALAGVTEAPWAAREIPPGVRDPELAADAVMRYFGATTLEPFGIADKPWATVAAAAVLDFLQGSQVGAVPQITTLTAFEQRDYMVLDRRALDDLEVFEPAARRTGAPTLLSVLDRTLTAMGRRLLRRWLSRPLLDLEALRARHDGVERFDDDAPLRRAARERLRRVPDLERLMNRVRTYAASARDLASLARGLEQIPPLKSALEDSSGGRSFKAADHLKECPEVVALVGAAIFDDPPGAVGDGEVIREGFDAELDEVRGLAGDARSRIAAVEDEARESTGIRALKVGYNKVFGYYIEVSRANLDRVPEEFERRQTLANAERFVTPQLKELESRILSARDRISELERSIFRRVCGEVAAYGDRIMRAASSIGQIDALAGLAETASLNGYVRPEMDESDEIEIVAGRHPVVEAALGPGRFVPNDVMLSRESQQIAVITGPNMSGKSTFIRQVALITLMAQAGGFVPAERARIGVADRIFTRSNLTDDISAGRSTFLIEMEETATILHQATGRSLVVLDEIGRGTSAYDGLAIARAVAEYLHSSPRLGCRTLFATHYHEMTALADSLPRAANYQVAVTEEDGEVVFLHRILPGGADRSYGVHVGRLAGLPQPVIARAWEVLEELESPSHDRRRDGAATVSGRQLPLLPDGSAVRDELLELDVSEMTPLEAITRLYELQAKARDESGAGAQEA